jgi:hypothetical protein
MHDDAESNQRASDDSTFVTVLDDGRGDWWKLVDERNLTVYSMHTHHNHVTKAAQSWFPQNYKKNTSDEAEVSADSVNYTRTKCCGFCLPIVQLG